MKPNRNITIQFFVLNGEYRRVSVGCLERFVVTNLTEQQKKIFLVILLSLLFFSPSNETAHYCNNNNRKNPATLDPSDLVTGRTNYSRENCLG